MKRKPLGLILCAVVAGALLVRGGFAAGPKWQGTPPDPAKDQKAWSSLLESMAKGKFYFGAMAASQRMLTLFTDLPTKEEAYRTIIDLIDKGYPFSSLSPFLPGDIDPISPTGPSDKNYAFYNNYYLYKSFVNREKKAKKWADNYLVKVDKENFHKVAFLAAIDAYNNGKLDEAEEKLRKLLVKDYDAYSTPFVRKMARTLARIYFDREQYDKALDVYLNFLLKLNPVVPSDWLEASWCLYHLKRYAEAVGMLYNLESRSAGKTISPEKYIIRALSYRELCDVPASEGLIQTFEADFGKMLKAIKQGEPFAKFPELGQLEIASNTVFRQVAFIISELEGEQARIPTLPLDQQALATYLYKSAVSTHRRQHNVLVDAAFERAAQTLIMVEEQLRFLKFDVAREKFNPDAVFMPAAAAAPALVEDGKGDTYILRWRQLGDFWRDERLIYHGALQNRCLQ